MSNPDSASLDRITSAFKAYLKESASASLDGKLKEYFLELRDHPRYRSGDPEFLDHILAQLAILFPLHLSRKHRIEDLCRTGNISALVSAFEENWLKKSLDDVLQPMYRSREHAINWSLPSPVTLVGYDPTRENAAEASAFYKTIGDELSKQNHIVFGEPTFVKSYNLAKAEIYRDFHDPSTRYDLLIVDFSWLPELAYQGHIIPLEPFAPDILASFREKTKESIDGSSALEIWTSVLDHLSSAGDGFHYAFPLLVNAHGRLAHVSHPLPENYDNFGESFNFEKCAIQTAHSACCVYELYAHLAFNRALPIRTSSGASAFGTTGCRIDEVNFLAPNTKNAIAGYLSRVRKSGVGQKKVREFAMNHADELNGLVKKSFGFDVCFNSELYDPFIQKLPRRDQGEWTFSAPYSQLQDGKTHYLTSLGGYGLAVSRQAVNPRDAFAMASRLFKHPQIDVIEKNIRTVLPFGGLDTADLDDFLTYHCRPRVPFWSHIEESISMGVQLIYDRWNTKTKTSSAAILQEQFNSIRAWLDEGEAIEILTRLKKSIELTFSNNGWQVGGV